MKFLLMALFTFSVALTAKADLDPALASKIDGWNFEPTSTGVSNLCGMHVEVSSGNLYVTNTLPPSMVNSGSCPTVCNGSSFTVACQGNVCGNFTVLDDGNIFAYNTAKFFRVNQNAPYWCK